MFKKLLLLVGMSALVYWVMRERLGSEEFEFTEIPEHEPAAAQGAPGAV